MKISLPKALSAIFIFSAISFGYIWLNEKRQEESYASQSCELVTKIFKDSYDSANKIITNNITDDRLSNLLNMNAPSCERVEIQNKVNDNFYQAKAYLSNGQSCGVGIKLEDGRIIVSISPL
ncbi:hypothetical protein [Edwardsiella piscicida]|uniref:hypothetical protein n=1 Tax=Edwardsiella piscicida TaxID=1263550 RepID=UPI0011B1ED14|nr:hypothetical protein [Edwardsiella piscicida]UCQ42967.1 hypothetical protein DCF39_09165 [Edwardsiella piscicida]